MDAWNRDEIRAEECQEITARTTALLREGDAVAALKCYEQDPTPPAMFGGDATLRQAFERHLDPGQQEEFRKMTGEVAKAEVLKKVSGGGYLQSDEQAAEDHAPEERGVEGGAPAIPIERSEAPGAGSRGSGRTLPEAVGTA
ncbi:hypothetical protein OJ996_18475 [Luteolibacter sp. GHJ8]|uniref:Uncharacterized protein n=1 Tax=Luteolibacter rhizosphaerae TaxID=2989719 RepID=A0ABT3G6V4_9BACT|nr:hypothetical protein [Luteolibacter rhizosphaerae]MCW1915577.1 hypothetical protein [Luteolibacter rhizosphaerae]